MRALLHVAAALAAAAAVTASGAGAARTAGDCTPDPSWPAARPAAAAQVLAALNDHRRSLGLATLQPSASLTRAAVWKARHMARYVYLAHDDPAPPVARSVPERVAACGYTHPAGEILAGWLASPAAAVAGWLASSGHRANIESPLWHAAGVGVAVSAGGIPFWAVDFGPVADAPPQAAAPCVVPSVLRLTRRAATARLRAAGCGVKVIRVTSTVGRGRVAWQSPRRGVHVPHRSPVTIALSL